LSPLNFWKIARKSAIFVKKAGVEGITFNDLRGTFVTRAAINGATEAEIASATGHSIGQVRSILDRHYLHRDPALGENLMEKLERGTVFSNRLSNRSYLIEPRKAEQ
jgi:integrase